MGCYDEINVKITGQSKEFSKRQMMAKLELVCAEFDLELTELYE